MTRYRVTLALLALLLAGCASKPQASKLPPSPAAPQTWRLTTKVLVPPGVADPGLALRTAKLDVPLGRGKCASAAPVLLERSGNSLRATITVADLAAEPFGWLRLWATDREAEGCIAAGQAVLLAQAVAESVPLPALVALRLQHQPFQAGQVSFVDLGPENRIQVDSPIAKDATAADLVSPEAQVSAGSGNSINVNLKTSASLIGYETAWYGLDHKPAGPGFTIVPLYAESHINGAASRAAEPRVNPFHFRPEAAFYRMFYRGDRTIVIVSAATPVELQRESDALRQDPVACDHFPAGSCVLLPNNMGANPHLVVTVNGTAIALPMGANLRAAITTAKGKPDDVLPKLIVRKPYGNDLRPVEFPAGSPDILNLPLAGGEEISWQ